MKKYYLLYSIVLYCSIDVLGCDCCKKLCGKSGEEGYEEEKSWEESKKTKWQFLERCDIQQEFLKKWDNCLKDEKNENQDDFVLIILEQHDVKAGCALDSNKDWELVCIEKRSVLKSLYEVVFLTYKLKKLIFYIDGDPNTTYRGGDDCFGALQLGVIAKDFEIKSSASSSLKVLFISYYAEK